MDSEYVSALRLSRHCLSVWLSQWLRWLPHGWPERYDNVPAILPHVSSLLLLGFLLSLMHQRFRSTAGSSTGFVFAIYNIGSIPAVFLTGPVNDYLGRRMGMFTGACLIILGTCIQAPSVNYGMFLGGRFILGFGVSFCCVSAPCYVSEMAHLVWRGTLTGLYNCTW
jgi:MFS family permease